MTPCSDRSDGGRHFDEDETIGWGIAKPVFFISGKHDPSPASA
jgi:hypothetical protein